MTDILEALQTPTALAADIDAVAALQEQESVAKAKAAAYKAQIDLIETRIAASMREAGLTLAAGRHGAAALATVNTYKVPPDAWGKLYAHIIETGEFDLLNKALSVTAMRERAKVGTTVPGVESVTFEKLTVKKVRP
jgi:hypothetical protein